MLSGFAWQSKYLRSSEFVIAVAQAFMRGPFGRHYGDLSASQSVNNGVM
jgi:hypothetical protein